MNIFGPRGAPRGNSSPPPPRDVSGPAPVSPRGHFGPRPRFDRGGSSRGSVPIGEIVILTQTVRSHRATEASAHALGSHAVIASSQGLCPAGWRERSRSRGRRRAARPGGGGQRDPQPMAAGTGWEAHPGDGAGELAPLQRGRGNTGFGEGERWRAPGRARLGRAEREERRSPERE
jgi:hypothetical protein